MNPIRHRRSFALWSGVVLGFVAVVPPASAGLLGELREEARQRAPSKAFGQSLQSLTGFAALPGVSAANYTVGGEDKVDDAEIVKFALPLSREFPEIEVFEANLHTELTLGYLTFDQSGELAPGQILEADLESLSVLGGVGLAFSLNERTTLRPILLFGYARIEDDGGASGPGAAEIEADLGGIVSNFTLNSALVGGALEIAYARSLGGDVAFSGDLRYNHLYANTFAASQAAFEVGSDFGVFTASAQVDGPTGQGMLGHRLRWIGFATNSSFTESAGTGVEYFFELGGGIEIVDRALAGGIQGLSLRASAIIGQQNVTGWSVYGQLEF